MVIMAILLVVALTLLAVMYATKRSDLGFVSAGFWFLAGAEAYTLRTFPVGASFYYWIFWLCSIGMTLFCVLASTGMRRERHDITDDTGKETPESIAAEGRENSTDDEREEKQPAVRRRANKRRSLFGGYKI